jgi:hypothetical protein
MRSSEHGIWRNYEPDATFAKKRLLSRIKWSMNDSSPLGNVPAQLYRCGWKLKSSRTS